MTASSTLAIDVISDVVLPCVYRKAALEQGDRIQARHSVEVRSGLFLEPWVPAGA